MPDLTTESYAQCKSATNWSVEIENSKGDNSYTVTLGPENPGECQVNWHCTCQGFKYRGNCKHVKQAQNKHCGWIQFYEPLEVAYDGNGDKICPKCKGPIEYRNWMV